MPFNLCLLYSITPIAFSYLSLKYLQYALIKAFTISRIYKMDDVSKMREELTDLVFQAHRSRQIATDKNVMIISARGRLVKGNETCFRMVPFLNQTLFLDCQDSHQKDDEGNILLDIHPESFYACIAYAHSAFMLQSLLLTKLSTGSGSGSVQELICTADHLGINIPTISTMDELVDLEKDLRNGKDDCEEGPDRSSARDAAARLCFSIAKGSIPMLSSNENNKIKQKVVTDTLFIVSHQRIFGPRLRTHLWMEFEKVITLTDKQRSKQFAEWVSDDGLKYDFYCAGYNDEDSGTDGSSIHEEDHYEEYCYEEDY